jgi:hypothetical protein
MYTKRIIDSNRRMKDFIEGQDRVRKVARLHAYNSAWKRVLLFLGVSDLINV